MEMIEKDEKRSSSDMAGKEEDRDILGEWQVAWQFFHSPVSTYVASKCEQG